MITQVGLEEQIKNVIGMARAYNEESKGKIDSLESLHSHYVCSLNKIQHCQLDGVYGKTNIVSNFEEAKNFCDVMSRDALTMLDDKDQSGVINLEYDSEAQAKAELLARARDCLQILSADHYTLFSLLITDIFLMPSGNARGGSTSTAIGVIWANPKLKYKITDIVEFLVHEMTHHAMFIDEHRYGHFDYSVVLNESTWATSAILKHQRPLDKVIHSLVVAMEIIGFRENFLGHPACPLVHAPTPQLITQVAKSLETVDEKIMELEKSGMAPVSDRAKQLLAGIKNGIENNALQKFRAA